MSCLARFVRPGPSQLDAHFLLTPYGATTHTTDACFVDCTSWPTSMTIIKERNATIYKRLLWCTNIDEEEETNKIAAKERALQIITSADKKTTTCLFIWTLNMAYIIYVGGWRHCAREKIQMMLLLISSSARIC